MSAASFTAIGSPGQLQTVKHRAALDCRAEANHPFSEEVSCWCFIAFAWQAIADSTPRANFGSARALNETELAAASLHRPFLSQLSGDAGTEARTEIETRSEQTSMCRERRMRSRFFVILRNY